MKEFTKNNMIEALEKQIEQKRIQIKKLIENKKYSEVSRIESELNGLYEAKSLIYLFN